MECEGEFCHKFDHILQLLYCLSLLSIICLFLSLLCLFCSDVFDLLLHHFLELLELILSGQSVRISCRF